MKFWLSRDQQKIGPDYLITELKPYNDKENNVFKTSGGGIMVRIGKWEWKAIGGPPLEPGEGPARIEISISEVSEE